MSNGPPPAANAPSWELRDELGHPRALAYTFAEVLTAPRQTLAGMKRDGETAGACLYLVLTSMLGGTVSVGAARDVDSPGPLRLAMSFLFGGGPFSLDTFIVSSSMFLSFGLLNLLIVFFVASLIVGFMSIEESWNVVRKGLRGSSGRHLLIFAVSMAGFILMIYHWMMMPVALALLGCVALFGTDALPGFGSAKARLVFRALCYLFGSMSVIMLLPDADLRAVAHLSSVIWCIFLCGRIILEQSAKNAFVLCTLPVFVLPKLQSIVVDMFSRFL